MSSLSIIVHTADQAQKQSPPDLVPAVVKLFERSQAKDVDGISRVTIGPDALATGQGTKEEIPGLSIGVVRNENAESHGVTCDTLLAIVCFKLSGLLRPNLQKSLQSMKQSARVKKPRRRTKGSPCFHVGVNMFRGYS